MAGQQICGRYRSQASKERSAREFDRVKCVVESTPNNWRDGCAIFEDNFFAKGIMYGCDWRTFKAECGSRSRREIGQIATRFSPETCAVKGVVDRRVNKLYALATQDGDAILNSNGKTRVLQRNDLLKAPMNTPKTVFSLKKVSRLNRLKSAGDAVRELYIQPIVNKTKKRRRKRRVKKVKDASEWGAPEWRASLQGKE